MSGPSQRGPRRPVRGSRPSSSAPRRIAGRSSRSQEEEPESVEATPPVEAAPVTEPAPVPEAVPAEEGVSARPAQQSRLGILARRRTTTVLAALLGVLLLGSVVAAGFAYPREDAVWFGVGEGASGGDGVWRYDPGEEFEVPERPVTVDFVEWRNATDAATNAVLEILTVDWKGYDEHLEAVRSRMTEEFYEEEYLQTARDSRERFVASKADYDFEVVGQSVVSADADEVTALLFLNQYVHKGEGEDRVGPEVYQVRVVVTAVASGDEWLVEDLSAL